MAKEILLYNGIYSYTAADFINQLEANKGNDICIRMNCPGGDVMASMGMIAKYNEHTGGKSVKVDGMAASMAAIICCMADDVECLDSSEFLFHRAEFPDWVENDKSIFTDELKAMLTRHNGVLRAAMENKLNIGKLKSITGKTLDEIFSMDSRIDVILTAKQAEKVGLVNKISPLNTAKKIEINALASSLGMAAVYNEAITETTIKTTVMTLSEIKANPALWAEVKTEILAEEKDRIESFAAWAEVDPKGALEAIVKGDKYTQSFGAKMQVKAMSKEGIANIAAANAKPVKTDEPDAAAQTDEQKAEAKAQKSFDNAGKEVLARFGVTATA